MQSFDSSDAQQTLLHFQVQPASVVKQDGAIFGLSSIDQGAPQLFISTPADRSSPFPLDGTWTTFENFSVGLGPCNHQNLLELRHRLPWLNPRPLGLGTSAGFGDRLGVATPGHLRALRAVGGYIAPIPAQQSIREMTRTSRSAQQVMEDAIWGVFAEGWQSGFGADADHLKTPADIDRCLAAGFTFYTFDPGEHVDNEADTASPEILRNRFEVLPWDRLEDTPTDLLKRYTNTTHEYEGLVLHFTEEQIIRASVKYGRAIAHIAMMYRYLEAHAGNQPWEVEVSVDETETPTTHGEHVYFVAELQRMGVHWVSLAPRFIGRFEKGVDYIGDLELFTKDIAGHAAIARALGPYKISLHSGSDKFSIYAIAAQATQGNVHLKTAGTSYLEALRTVGQLRPALLKEIYAFAFPRYETDRASYHVSAQLDRAPEPASVNDTTASVLLDEFDAREILHVTFGSVLTYQTPDGERPFAVEIMKVLRQNPDAYAMNLVSHFIAHLQPFVVQSHV